MCGFCGVFLTETHWSDGSVAGPQPGGRTRRQERAHRVALANRVLRQYGLKLADWQGSAYLLSSQTGQTEVVPSVAAVWPAAELLRKIALDPFDETLLEALERD